MEFRGEFSMDLLDNIRNCRARQKRKRPYKPTGFSRVSALVKKYGLGEDFLQLLDSPENWRPYKNMETSQVKLKDPFDFPLFSLSTKEEYALAEAIANKVDTPYLQFAHTPEEILLAAPLYEANPLLGPEDLQRYHFSTLLLYERAKMDLTHVNEHLTIMQTSSTPGDSGKISDKERLRLDSLQQRKQELRAFIAKVENKKLNSG